MEFFRAKYPAILKCFYPERISHIKDEHSIYLTFDDGPIPEVTPWVLKILKDFDAKATFFCIGENVQKHPEIFRQILAEGHSIGNHTFNHLNGWKTSSEIYLENIRKTAIEIQKNQFPKAENCKPEILDLKIFRPPFGKIKNRQARKIVKLGYKIVMWDVVSGDYNENYSAETCKNNVLKNARPGSTIVFHDSQKAFKNLQEILPEILQFYSEKRLKFRSLEVLAKKAN